MGLEKRGGAGHLPMVRYLQRPCPDVAPGHGKGHRTCTGATSSLAIASQNYLGIGPCQGACFLFVLSVVCLSVGYGQHRDLPQVCRCSSFRTPRHCFFLRLILILLIGVNRWLSDRLLLFVGLTFVCTPAVAHVALGSLEWQYAPANEMPIDAEAIVVLSAGVRPPSGARAEAELDEDSLQRCLHAANLYQRAGHEWLGRFGIGLRDGFDPRREFGSKCRRFCTVFPFMDRIRRRGFVCKREPGNHNCLRQPALHCFMPEIRCLACFLLSGVS
jgi:hypothetical protein